MKKCPTCGNMFEPRRANHVYCVTRCKKRASKRRERGYPESDKEMDINRHAEKVRHALMYVLSKHYTLQEVGEILSRHHSTVIYGVNKVKDNFEEYEDEINRITKQHASHVEMCNKFLLRRKA